MGTNAKVKLKQQQIKELLAKLNLSISNFAGLVFDAHYDEFDEIGERKFAEKIKKQLQRETTSEEILDSYLDILTEHPSYQNLNLGKVRSQYVNHNCLDDELSLSLAELSAELDETRGE